MKEHDSRKRDTIQMPRALQSKTFCVHPWIEQTVLPSGSISMCCVASNGGVIPKEGEGVYRAYRESLENARNSKFMRDLRQKMLAGEKHPSCQFCYFQESIGKDSYRENFNREWMDKIPQEIISRVDVSKKNDLKVAAPPIYLDLRLGNTCNLKCRMCNSYNSSKILDETSEMFKENDEFREIHLKYHSTPAEKTVQWFESKHFWTEVLSSIPHLKKIYLTGGEPTLIRQNQTFLKACIDQKYAKGIALVLNINATNVSDEFLDIISQFNFVSINISIDGISEVNDYIRSGSRWPLIHNNIKKLLKSKKKFRLGFTPVIQTYNILSIVELLRYVEDISMENDVDLGVDFLYVLGKSYLEIEILPESIRQLSAEKLLTFVKTSSIYKTNSLTRNSIDSCINLLQKPSVENFENRRQDFLTFTRLLDRQRKQNIEKSLPELSQLLHSQGYSFSSHEFKP